MFDALRKARARAEIDRLTNGPDAIYGLPSNSKEAEIEMRFDKLEFLMTRAVDKTILEQQRRREMRLIECT